MQTRCSPRRDRSREVAEDGEPKEPPLCEGGPAYAAMPIAFALAAVQRLGADVDLHLSPTRTPFCTGWFHTRPKSFRSMVIEAEAPRC